MASKRSATAAFGPDGTDPEREADKVIKIMKNEIGKSVKQRATAIALAAGRDACSPADVYSAADGVTVEVDRELAECTDLDRTQLKLVWKLKKAGEASGSGGVPAPVVPLAAPPRPVLPGASISPLVNIIAAASEVSQSDLFDEDDTAAKPAGK